MTVTLKEIAKKLGLSTITVSRAISDRGSVKSATKKKIIDTARHMGYVKNVTARNLALNRSSNSIGLIISNISNPFYAKMTQIMQIEALKRGYSLTLFNTMEDDQIEKKALQTLQEERCAGALISAVGKSEEHILESVGRSFPVIMVNRRPKSKLLDYIVCDTRKGAQLATAHLLMLGHKKIAHITGPEYTTSVEEKLKGYKRALALHGIAFNKDYVIHKSLTLEGGYEGVKELRAKFPEVTAVFVYCDWIAIGVMKALQEMNLRIPEDMSVIGFDNIDIASSIRSPLTTVDLPVSILAQEAIKELVQKIEKGFKNHHTKMKLQPHLVIRASCSTAN